MQTTIITQFNWMQDYLVHSKVNGEHVKPMGIDLTMSYLEGGQIDLEWPNSKVAILEYSTKWKHWSA